ncbi:MAG: hypothetical protein OEV64_06190 [Desulfobulbaceae bacterium]|nr:hypothetical protein [Desulfobulbaceae bacterium]
MGSLTTFLDFTLEFLKSPLCNLLSLFIGIAIGNKLATDKEQKEEKNKVTEKFQVLLINDKRRIRTNIRPDLAIQKVHAENFRTFLSWNQRRAFDRDWNAYREVESQEFGKKFIGGRPHYANRAKVILKLGEVLKHVNYKK